MDKADRPTQTPPAGLPPGSGKKAFFVSFAWLLIVGFAIGVFWRGKPAPTPTPQPQAPNAVDGFRTLPEDAAPLPPLPKNVDTAAVGRVRRDVGWSLERARRLDGGQGIREIVVDAGRLWWRGERHYFAEPQNPLAALACYLEVSNTCTRLLRLNKQRLAATRTRTRTLAAQTLARNFRAALDAAPLWNRAERASRRGNALFERGQFDEAFAQWITASQDYADAADQARAVQEERRRLEQKRLEQERLNAIAACIRRAQYAEKHEKWRDMRTAAQDALALDPQNQPAAALLIQAERHLLPTVTLSATARGNNVSASITGGANWSGNTPKTFPLEKNAAYSVSFLYQSGNYYYAGTLSFTVTPDWEGERFLSVPLERLNDWLLTLADGVRLKMKWIPSGTFLMGSHPHAHNEHNDEYPLHPVTLSKGYWIGESEVTQAQWQAIMGHDIQPNHPGPKLPMENLGWGDALAFCQALNKRDKNQLPKHYLYALPTEAQWEYACRAGSTTAYCFGDDPAELCHYGNYCDRSNAGNYPWQDLDHNDGFDTTAPVKSFLPNAWGLYDMHGNVWEWCHDWSGPYPNCPVQDPSGPPSGNLRMYRGGAFNRNADFCRSANRFSNESAASRDNIGFRLVLAPVR